MRLLLASLNDVEKNCHGSIAVRITRKYGTSAGTGNFPILPNTAVKINVISSGRITAHATPMAVCL